MHHFSSFIVDHLKDYYTLREEKNRGVFNLLLPYSSVVIRMAALLPYTIPSALRGHTVIDNETHHEAVTCNWIMDSYCIRCCLLQSGKEVTDTLAVFTFNTVCSTQSVCALTRIPLWSILIQTSFHDIYVCLSFVFWV